MTPERTSALKRLIQSWFIPFKEQEKIGQICLKKRKTKCILNIFLHPAKGGLCLNPACKIIIAKIILFCGLLWPQYRGWRTK